MRSIILGGAQALVLAFLLNFSSAAQGAQAATEKSAGSSDTGAADAAWAELLKLSEPPHPPDAWQTTRPSQEEIEKFEAKESERLAKAADKAKDFQTRFPGHANADQAGAKEYDLLQAAAQMGNTNVFARLDTIEEAKLKDPNLSGDERFKIRAGAVNRKAMSKMGQGMAAAMAELEKGVRALVKEFPNQPEGYQMLLEVASESEPDKTRQLAQEITTSPAPDQIKDAARDILKRLERVGKPVAIQFAAVDGRAVDLSKMRGKVVLVDFWATWCGPCVQEVPNVRATFEKLHPKGFEIVGISFDRNKDSLLSFVDKQKMTWPQYFDGKQWENDYGKQFGIQSIPTMWLVDKKGNLRDLNARADLASKIEKLLAENP
jgi:thiol-disulfide isomerase/thioredoxin